VIRRPGEAAFAQVAGCKIAGRVLHEGFYSPMTRVATGKGWLLPAALVLGLMLRGVILWQTQTLGMPISDERDYARLAGHILSGDGFVWDLGKPTSIRPPLYPALVAGVWAIAGPGNLQAVRLAQVVLALLTTALIFQLGRQVFDSTVGRWAAAAFWLYPSLIFFNFTILTETLFTFLLVAFVWLTVTLVQTPRAWIALLSGMTLGLAALTRSVLWPVPLILCPLIALLIRAPVKAKLLLPALVLVGYVVAVAPWAVRNTRLQGVVTIVDTMGGLNLRMGNYEYTPDDRMWSAVGIEGEQSWSYELAREHPGQRLTEGQKDKWAQRKAVEYMLANPGNTARRSLIKFADFWGLEREFAAGVQEGVYQPPRSLGILIAAMIVVTYAGLAILGAAGIWLAAPEWRVHVVMLLPLLVITGIHTLAFGHSRYHLPLVPILALYGMALVAIRRSIEWPQQRSALAGAAATILIFVVIWVRQIITVDAGHIRAILQASS
jgi:4-amino-4-deoxy-L-arabinose transferase-like glycosyltransferase